MQQKYYCKFSSVLVLFACDDVLLMTQGKCMKCVLHLTAFMRVKQSILLAEKHYLWDSPQTTMVLARIVPDDLMSVPTLGGHTHSLREGRHHRPLPIALLATSVVSNFALLRRFRVRILQPKN